MTQEINCNFKSHIPRIMTVPGILLIHENKLSLRHIVKTIIHSIFNSNSLALCGIEYRKGY